jgi:type I restriction enzyme M protein
LPANTNQALSIIRLKEGHNPFYVASILRSHIVTDKIENLKTGVAQFNLSLEQIKDFEIPLPPLEIQEQIVTEIQGYQKIIDGAKQVVNNYKPTITINPDWEMVELGTLATFVQGINTAIDKLNYVEDGIKVLQANNIYLGQINFDNLKYITREEFETINPKYKPSIDDVLYSNIGARFGYASNVDFNDEFTYSWNVLRLIINDKEKVNKNYLKVILNQESIRQEVIRKNASSTMPFISGKELKLIQIPIPTISEQQTIVKAIEEELQLVNANKRLIKIFEQKIKTKIGEVWGVETITN